MSYGKETYERKKRLKAERLLRDEEERDYAAKHQDKGELLVASIAASLETIADALSKMAEK